MPINSIIAVRGAITLSENTKKEIEQKSVELANELIKRNSIGVVSQAVSLIISTTPDITAFYPAAAVRESGVLPDCPLFSALEPSIDNSLKLCLRMMITISSKEDNLKAVHAYLGEAALLRRDLADEKE